MRAPLFSSALVGSAAAAAAGAPAAPRWPAGAPRGAGPFHVPVLPSAAAATLPGLASAQAGRGCVCRRAQPSCCGALRPSPRVPRTGVHSRWTRAEFGRSTAPQHINSMAVFRCPAAVWPTRLGQAP